MISTAPSIYVADLAAYNEGILSGEWISLEGRTADEVNDRIREVLAQGTKDRRAWMIEQGIACVDDYLTPSEEFAIHDHQGFGNIEIGEYTPIERVMAWVDAIDRTYDGERLFAWVEYIGEHCADPDDFSEDSVVGPWADREELARDCVDTYFMKLPSVVENYIDYDAMGRDLMGEGEYVEYNGKVWEITDY